MVKVNNKTILRYLLIPFSWIYGFVVYLRNCFFDLHILSEKKFDLPVISVGNITVGGTGKTPHVEYLIQLLKTDFRVAILSRGYKRKTHGFILAGSTSSYLEIGDEPCQIKSKFNDIEVAVDADRVHGIEILLSTRNDIDVIILDDAFQHRFVKPGISILLIDFNRPVNKDFLLPSGRLREPASSARRADIIIITKTPPETNQSEQRTMINNLDLLSSQSVYFTTVIYEDPKSVFSLHASPRSGSLLANKPAVLLISGIAVPDDLKRYVGKFSPHIIEMHFPDHHNYSKKDMIHIMKVFDEIREKDKIIITTEKDSVRFQKLDYIPDNLKRAMFYISIKIAFLDDEEDSFNKQIINYVRNNK